MVNNHAVLWSCFGCGISTNVLHEVFFGTSKRIKSIRYDIQIPLCPKCHNAAHGRKTKSDANRFRRKSQDDIKHAICDFLGLDYYKACYEINQGKSYYLLDNSEQCLSRIATLEV